MKKHVKFYNSCEFNKTFGNIFNIPLLLHVHEFAVRPVLKTSFCVGLLRSMCGFVYFFFQEEINGKK